MMTILIDINHPAHVHYFKNAVKIFKEEGHEIVIVARNRYPTLELLDSLNEKYYSRGKGSNHIIGKFLYIAKADFYILKLAGKFRPDLYLSFVSPYPNHISKLLGKKSISFTDTEAAKLHKIYTYPFTDIICTPSWFCKDLGKKHIRFHGFMEQCYLHPRYFTPDPGIFKHLGLKENERYALLRFVSWGAHHDIGQTGLSVASKIQAVNEFSRFVKVFISSEGPLPGELEKYRIQIPPQEIHHALAFADLYLGEGATMATESALLGTPAICVSSCACDCGNFQELKNYDLIQCFTPEKEKESVAKALDILKNENSKKECRKKRDQLLNNTIDVTSFLAWLVKDYPESTRLLKENPDYQWKFKSLTFYK